MTEEKHPFILKIFQKERQLEISAFESPGDWKGPVRNFIEHPFSEMELHKHRRGIIDIFNKCNQLGEISPQDVRRLKAIGQLLYDELLPVEVKRRLASTQAVHLVLDVDDSLNTLPWELLFDGGQFLCLKFSMGRVVRAKNAPGIVGLPRRIFNSPLRMLTLADPQNNLWSNPAHGPEANEGEMILDCLSRQNWLAVDYKSGPIDSDYVKMYLRDYDLIHYAGHAEYAAHDPAASGWLLADRKLLAADIIKMLGDEKPLPALIFSNACQSGITGRCEAENVYDLAKIFLLGGVQHYIGTVWDILSKPSSHFAAAFYRELAAGLAVGEALRNARRALISSYGEEVIIWASYILYGDPAVSYLEIARRANKAEIRPDAPESTGQPDIVRGPGTNTAAPIAGRGLGRRAGYIIGGSAVLATLLAVTAARVYHSHTPGHENTGRPDYYSAAQEHIRQGDELFNRGETEPAMVEYLRAAQAEQSGVLERALAYARLGQGYSRKKDYAQAIASYSKALEYDNRNPALYSDKGLALAKLGNYTAAREQFRQAMDLNPQDKLTGKFLEEIEQRMADAEDSARQQRLNRLIHDLVELYRQPKTIPPPLEEGTAAALTLTFLNFKTGGSLSGREGEDEYILLKIMDYLRTTGKVKVVERQLLEKLLEELKLGASELADPQVSAKLGRILAARFIVTGNLIHDSDRFQVGLRLVETETTLIKAAIAENFDPKLPLDKIAEKLAREIEEKAVGS